MTARPFVLTRLMLPSESPGMLILTTGQPIGAPEGARRALALRHFHGDAFAFRPVGANGLGISGAAFAADLPTRGRVRHDWGTIKFEEPQ